LRSTAVQDGEDVYITYRQTPPSFFLSSLIMLYFVIYMTTL